MKTIRRLYFYAVAAVSVEVVLWGLVGLLRSIFGSQRWVGAGAGDLASALALILVGIPIFAVHWLWAQKAAAREEEERAAGVRAVFLYGILLGALIPVAQNLAALINRLLLSFAQISANRALVGGEQNILDNAIAVVVNLAIAAYFWNVLRADWTALSERENFSETRRLYRFVWLIYSLALTVYGVQQIIVYIFSLSTNTLNSGGRETLINALTLLIVGTPIWIYVWRLLQNALADADEKESYLRLGLLYLIVLGSLIVFLSSSGSALHQLLAQALGAKTSAADLIRGLGGSLSLAIPFGALWAYYGTQLNRQFSFDENLPRRAGKRRLYVYVLSFFGLASAVAGVLTLASALIQLALGSAFIGEGVGKLIAAPLSFLIIGVPLWLFNWNSAQKQAHSADESGDHARRSTIRKTYLYLISFLAIIGAMVSAGTLLFDIINAALGGSDSPILESLLIEATALIVFSVTLTYHLLAIRADGAARADKLGEKQSAYRVAILDADGKFGEALKAVFAKRAPQIPLTVVAAADLPELPQADALILPASAALRLPQNIAAQMRSFNGDKFVVNDEAADVFWADSFEDAANSAKARAEGQEARPRSKRANTLWRYVVYIGAALFACQWIFVLLALLVSLVTGGF